MTIEHELALAARITALEDALRPFATAGKRCKYYRFPRENAQIIVIDPSHSQEWELFAKTTEFEDNDDELLTVQRLLDANEVLNNG